MNSIKKKYYLLVGKEQKQPKAMGCAIFVISLIILSSAVVDA